MVGSARILLLSAVLAGLATTAARAQAPAVAREPDAPHPSPFTVPASAAPGAPQAPTVSGGPPLPQFAPAPLPGPYFEPDSLLDRPPLPQPGWFAEAELGVVTPHVKNHLSGQVQLPGAAAPDTVMLGSAGLDWTVFPRVEAGYRLPSGFGAFSLSYRSLASDGTAATQGPDGPATLHSRLGLDEIGLDYSNAETSLWPNWDMKWTVGVRLVYVFFDSRADEAPALAVAGSTVVEQRESNWYCGFGPHVGLELDRQIAGTGLAVVLRGSGTLYLGRLNQGFFEESTTSLSAEARTPVSQAVPSAGLFLGVRWQPPQWKDCDFYAGYQYEHWWDVGKNNDTTSTGELNVQGIILQAGYRY